MEVSNVQVTDCRDGGRRICRADARGYRQKPVMDPRSAPVSQGSGLFSAARLRPAKSMSFRHRRHHRRAWVIVEPDAK